MKEVRSRIFRPYAQWIVSHRLIVMLVILGVTAFLASRVGSIQFDSNPNLWAPQKHVYVETTNLLDEVFGGSNVTVIGIVPRQDDVYQSLVLVKIN